jgi:hypothetical protein
MSDDYATHLALLDRVDWKARDDQDQDPIVP